MSSLESKSQALQLQANAQLRSNDILSAHQTLTQLAELKPTDVNVLSQFGWTSLTLGNLDAAIAIYKQVIALAPDYIDANYYLAMAYGQAGNTQQARQSLVRVLQLDPKNVNALIKLGYIDFLAGNTVSTMSLLKRARKLEPENVELNIRFGRLYMAMNEFSKAEKHLRIALEIEPENVEAIGELASLHSYAGDNEKAYSLLSPFLEQETIQVSILIVFAEICRSIGKCDEAKESLERALEQEIDNVSKSSILFALGKILDREEDFSRAFQCFKKANDLYGFSYSSWDERQTVTGILDTFSSEYVKKLPKSKKLGKQLQPVFIIGMPRSGTSLIEQILSSHSKVHGAGERMEIPGIAAELQSELNSHLSYPFYLPLATQAQLTGKAKQYLKEVASSAPSTAKVVTDKMPDNYRHLALIAQMFPKAKIIHCVRTPVDNCLSCYFTPLMGNAYSYNLKNLGEHYGFYRVLMNHWKKVLRLPVLDVQYEDVVANPEKTSRDIIEFCGLEWEEGCLNYHENKRNVVTASSDQVRQPIYTRSVGRWKHYESHITDLIESLKKSI